MMSNGGSTVVGGLDGRSGRQNVLILTISFFVVFVAGMFTGREMLYLAEGRQRRKERKDYRHLRYLIEDDVPPVAGGYIDDESKHWPKEDNNDQ